MAKPHALRESKYGVRDLVKIISTNHSFFDDKPNLVGLIGQIVEIQFESHKTHHNVYRINLSYSKECWIPSKVNFWFDAKDIKLII